MQVAGVSDVPGGRIQAQAYNYARQVWTTFAEVAAERSATWKDGSGRPFYRFSAHVVLPQEPAYWAPGGKKGRMKAKLRAVCRGRVLPSFDDDAEACLRRAKGQKRNPLDVLRDCESEDSPAAQLFVKACGGPGQSCCDYHGASAHAKCAQPYLCNRGTCRSPPYPAPVVPDYQMDISLEAEYALRDVWLQLDDRSTGPDTELKLMSDYRPLRGVRRLTPQPNVARIAFDLPLWKPGVNRFRLRGCATGPEGKRCFTTPHKQFLYRVPDSLGYQVSERGHTGQQQPGRRRAGQRQGGQGQSKHRRAEVRRLGVFRLPDYHFPMSTRECGARFCKDADGDGLNDLWENVALHQLRPRLMMDSQDELFRPHNSRDAVRVFTSVYPLRKSGRLYVLFANVIAFSRDYGLPELFGLDHPGDTEAWGMAFRVAEDGTLHWAASVAKGHPCLTCNPKWTWRSQDFGSDGVPLVFVEEDKHGTWPSGRQCRKEAAFSCRGNQSLRPPAVNAGDWSDTGPRALVDALDGLSPSGPHGELSGAFPGEAVWTSGLAHLSGRFCGGVRRGCTQLHSANMPGAVIANLIRQFRFGNWQR